MASMIRRIRRTRVKLEHGYDQHHWWQHGSQHPSAIRHRAAWRRGPFAPPSLPAVVDRLTRVHEQLDGIKAARVESYPHMRGMDIVPGSVPGTTELFDSVGRPIPYPEGPRDAALVDAYPAH